MGGDGGRHILSGWRWVDIFHGWMEDILGGWRDILGGWQWVDIVYRWVGLAGGGWRRMGGVGVSGGDWRCSLVLV